MSETWSSRSTSVLTPAQQQAIPGIVAAAQAAREAQDGRLEGAAPAEPSGLAIVATV